MRTGNSLIPWMKAEKTRFGSPMTSILGGDQGFPPTGPSIAFRPDSCRRSDECRSRTTDAGADENGAINIRSLKLSGPVARGYAPERHVRAVGAH
jgi:hypothetical protein